MPYYIKKKKKEKVLYPGVKKVPNYKAKLDKIFSEYIRYKYADTNGYCRCISCGRIHKIKEIQNGHYMSRRYMSTRFDEDNCRPQCVACNIYNQGNIQMYRINLIKEIGERRVELVEIKARTQTHKYSDFEYQELIKYYGACLKLIKEKKGL